MDKAGIEVLGVLPRRGDLALPERHLGLIQAVEHPDLDKAIADYAAFVAEHVNLDRLLRLRHLYHHRARTAGSAAPPGQHIALARDEAFPLPIRIFWRIGGPAGQSSAFSRLSADECPDAHADVIWLPGGYPELHAGRLAAAETCFAAIRTMLKRGLCTVNAAAIWCWASS